MQRDAQLFADYDAGNATQPICFFYTWDHVAITIGRIQSQRDKLIQEATDIGIPCYLRPTGGRAVLHGADICYTFIASTNHPEFGGTLAESFKKVNLYMIGLFNQTLGLDIYSAQMTKMKSNNFNCFATTVGNEALIQVETGSYKVMGAAQAMGRRCFIQQGSLQVNSNNSTLSYFKDTYSISKFLGRELDLNEVSNSLNLQANAL